MKFTDQHCLADPLVESDSGMLAFPWLTKTASGTLVMSYHDGTDGPTGTSRIKTSTDLGVTWTTGRVVWDEGMASGAQIVVLPNGDWLLTSQISIGGSHAGVYTKRSTDGGTTWAASQFVTNIACSGGVWTSSAPLVLTNGALLWPVYGPDGGTSDVAKVLISLDLGASWTVAGTVLTVAGTDASESTLVQLPSGSVVALTRCGDFVLRRTVSADGGYTWSTPQTVTTGVNSRVDWVKTSSGRCYAGWRDSASSCEMVSWSDDDMASAAPPVQVHGPDSRTSYSALSEVRPGQVLAAIGEIDDGEHTGRIMGRYLLDIDGIAPTGQVTYLDDLRVASGESNVVAWDTFRRPDNAHGLGSADSGHQWLEFGGATSNDWKLTGNTATNANSTGRIHSVTLNTGTSDGYVEADLLWSGSTSSPIGLCARRSTVTGHALVTKLDASGTTLRICYFDGTNPNDLITPVSGLHYGPNVWHRWRLLVKDNYVRVFIDLHEAASYVLTSTDIANLSGGTRWGAWGGGSSGTTYKMKNLIIST